MRIPAKLTTRRTTPAKKPERLSSLKDILLPTPYTTRKGLSMKMR